MKAEDVFGPLRKVRNAVAKAGDKLGFDMVLFGGVPDHLGSDHRVQLIFRVDEERVGQEPPPDKDETDKTIEEMERAEKERLRDEERETARDDLLDILKDKGPKGGFLE